MNFSHFYLYTDSYGSKFDSCRETKFLLNAFKTRSKLYDKFNVELDYFLRRFHSINT
jgi:hypothetical protein